MYAFWFIAFVLYLMIGFYVYDELTKHTKLFDSCEVLLFMLIWPIAIVVYILDELYDGDEDGDNG